METDELSNKTIEMNITDIKIYDKENTNLVKIGDRNFTFKFPESTFNQNYKLQKIAEKNITHRQINNIEKLNDENQINYVYSVLVSQILPENYSFPQPVSIYYHNNNETFREYSLCILNESINFSEKEILQLTFFVQFIILKMFLK
jgi:hypothetical protein